MKRCLVLLMLLILSLSASAQEWSRFRGPNGAGHGDATLPLKWTDKDFNWKVRVLGVGHSSPILWGDRLFLTSGEPKTGKQFVLCYSATDGKLLWNREFDTKTYKTHKRNSLATSTPVVDDKRLYVASVTPAEYAVRALDHDGKDVWKIDLGPYTSQHGFGVSLTRYEDLLILPNQPDGDGSLVAVEAETGKVRWKTPRQGKNATYSTPCVYQPKGKPAELIFTNWQHGITGVDPKTGKVNWEISCFERDKNERAIASPIVAGDLVIGTCGFVTAQKHFVAVRPYAEDGKPKEIWRMEASVSYMPTPVVKGEWVFCCSEKGIGTCLHAATGKVLWQERVGGSYSASPVCVGDHIYCVSDDGKVVVLAAKDKFEVLAENSFGEPTQSTPALANGRMYFRTETHLISLGGKK